MASLTGNLISNSYLGLLKTVDNAALTTATKNITDGNGNATALSLSTNTTVVSGSLQVTGSVVVDSFPDGTVATLLPQSLVVGNLAGTIGAYTDMHGFELYSGSNYLDITVDGANFGAYVSGSLIAVSNNIGNPTAIIQFQNRDNWTDGTIDVNVPMNLHSSSIISGSVNVTGSVSIAGGLVLTSNSTFVLPLLPAAAPVVGSAYFSGGFLYIYNGTAYKSASLS
jgi:hypothetical protein